MRRIVALILGRVWAACSPAQPNYPSKFVKLVILRMLELMGKKHYRKHAGEMHR